jgi:hypothetical protein
MIVAADATTSSAPAQPVEARHGILRPAVAHGAAREHRKRSMICFEGAPKWA